MEIVQFGDYKWQKYKGKEGQDIFVALFMVEEEGLAGKTAEESDYDILIQDDADFYLPPANDLTKGDVDNEEFFDSINESQIAFRFRKNVFTIEEQRGAYEGLYLAAKESHNRGMAAGGRDEMIDNRDWVTTFQMDVLDYYASGSINTVIGNALQDIYDKHSKKQFKARGKVWLTEKVKKTFECEYEDFFDIFMAQIKVMDRQKSKEYAQYIKDDFISATSYASPIWSGIAGFYGRYPRIPFGRPTRFTEDHFDGLVQSYPFARKLEADFKRMLPKRHALQEACADRVDNKFLIGEDTTFTTITVNTTQKDRKAGMAYHKDSGSLNEGFSNLTTVSDGVRGWSKGYLVTPQIRAAIDIRPGDLLLIDNMRVLHGNMPIEPPVGGTVDDLLRMSLVYYFREDMLKLGSYEYEVLRRSFVTGRMKDKDHPLQRTRWNGVSPDMWASKEWYNYALSKGGREMITENQQDLIDLHENESTLDEFF